MKKSYKVFFLLVVLLASAEFAYAGTPPPPPPPPGLPIDGGISFLVITGILYGVFKLRGKK